MAKSKAAYRPPPEQIALMPEISGNAINGLGETTPRRPKPIYWQRPETISHGPLMSYMIERFNAVPALHAVYADPSLRGEREVAAIGERRAADSPEGWSGRVKTFARDHEADLVGITAFDPRWLYQSPETPEPGDHPWIIMLGIAMDHAALAASHLLPEDITSALEVARQYNRGARASRALANWIRRQGWFARPHTGPWAGSATLIPPALACGFGELGKHGSIINRELGSSFRLAAVVTDMPLAADPRDEFGADGFCENCRICTDACPPDAIFRSKQTVRGARKWYVDFDKCIPYFNDTHGCGICIAACPWSRPGVAPRLATKLARRAQRKRQDKGSA